MLGYGHLFLGQHRCVALRSSANLSSSFTFHEFSTQSCKESKAAKVRGKEMQIHD
jgi:hypothetical protein